MSQSIRSDISKFNCLISKFSPIFSYDKPESDGMLTVFLVARP